MRRPPVMPVFPGVKTNRTAKSAVDGHRALHSRSASREQNLSSPAENRKQGIGMGLSAAIFIACFAAAQVSRASASLTTHLDAVVRSMMPDWVREPMGPLDPPDPRTQVFRWRKHSPEPGGDLLVRVQTYDTPEDAEREL